MALKKEKEWPRVRVYATKNIDKYVAEIRKADPGDYYNQIFNKPLIKIENEKQN